MINRSRAGWGDNRGVPDLVHHAAPEVMVEGRNHTLLNYEKLMVDGKMGCGNS